MPSHGFFLASLVQLSSLVYGSLSRCKVKPPQQNPNRYAYMPFRTYLVTARPVLARRPTTRKETTNVSRQCLGSLGCLPLWQIAFGMLCKEVLQRVSEKEIGPHACRVWGYGREMGFAIVALA